MIEWGVEDSAERLDGDMGVSVVGLVEGHGEEVRAVDKFWVVAVSGDAIIVGHPFVLAGAILGDGIAGEGEGK